MMLVAVIVNRSLSRGQVNRNVTVNRMEVEEIILNDLPFVTKGNDKLGYSMDGINVHDVPEDRPPAYFDHGFGPQGCLFRQATPKPASQNHCFHGFASSVAIRTWPRGP